MDGDPRWESLWDAAMKELIHDEMSRLMYTVYERGLRDCEGLHKGPIPLARCYESDNEHPSHIWFIETRHARRCLGQEITNV